MTFSRDLAVEGKTQTATRAEWPFLFLFVEAGLQPRREVVEVHPGNIGGDLSRRLKVSAFHASIVRRFIDRPVAADQFASSVESAESEFSRVVARRYQALKFSHCQRVASCCNGKRIAWVKKRGAPQLRGS